MNVPPSSPERTPPPPIPLSEAGRRRAEEPDFVPRYVALPQYRERGFGRRNLIGGSVLLVMAAVLLAWAWHLAGMTALFTLGVCLATTTLLYVMARSRLFRQRNGSFVAWSAVCLLGVFLVLVHQGWTFLTGPVREPTKVAVAPASGTSPATVAVPPPLLHEAFPPPKLDANAGLAVRVTRDISVSVGEKIYRAKTGDVYPLADVGIGEMTVMVGGHEVLIPNNAAEMVGGEKDDKLVAMTPAPLSATKGRAAEPSAGVEKSSTTKLMEQAQMEAVRRYPALGRRGSPENQLFLTAKREQEFSGEKEFFMDPQWPLNLAEILAEKEGWKRADQPEAPARPAPPEPGAGAETQLFPPGTNTTSP